MLRNSTSRISWLISFKAAFRCSIIGSASCRGKGRPAQSQGPGRPRYLLSRWELIWPEGSLLKGSSQCLVKSGRSVSALSTLSALSFLAGSAFNGPVWGRGVSGSIAGVRPVGAAVKPGALLAGLFRVCCLSSAFLCRSSSLCCLSAQPFCSSGFWLPENLSPAEPKWFSKSFMVFFSKKKALRQRRKALFKYAGRKDPATLYLYPIDDLRSAMAVGISFLVFFQQERTAKSPPVLPVKGRARVSLHWPACPCAGRRPERAGPYGMAGRFCRVSGGPVGKRVLSFPAYRPGWRNAASVASAFWQPAAALFSSHPTALSLSCLTPLPSA